MVFMTRQVPSFIMPLQPLHEPRLVGARSSLRSSGRILDISPAAMTLQFGGGLAVYLATSPAVLRRFEPNFYSATGASRRTEFRLRHA